MDHLELISTLAVGLSVALVFGYITNLLGLSPIVGYLLAGVAVGPSTPGFVANRELAEQMAEVGVILLMFGVGLHFHWEDLLSVRRVAVPGALGQSLLATLLGAVVGWTLGWGWTAGIVFGLAISVASTVVLLRVLSDNNDLHTPAGHIAVGWLVVEDIFTVVVLVLLPSILGHGGGAAEIPWMVALALIKIATLVAIVIVAGSRVIPWLLSRVAATRSRELFTLTILAVALGISVGAERGLGVSVALGAFLAGMAVGRSEFSLRAATEALPMRDAFAVLFFVSVGMLFDPSFPWRAPLAVTLTLAVILFGKSFAALVLVLGLGYPLRIALTVAVALAQIGEFSFILAGLGKDLGIITPEMFQTLVAAAIISISLNPPLYRGMDAVESWARRRPRLGKLLNTRRGGRSESGEPPLEMDAPGFQHRAVVIGYGPVGQTLSRILVENEIEPTVIEMNLETVQRLKREGRSVVYGDATHRDTLLAANVAGAGTIVLSASNITGCKEIIRLARELNPDIRLLVRSTYLRERNSLKSAGADRVYSEEGEVALAMATSILEDLGATPEQIDRERDRVQSELFGEIPTAGTDAIPKPPTA